MPNDLQDWTNAQSWAIVLGSVTAAAGGSASSTFPIPPGTIAIGWNPFNSASTHSISVTGVQTGIVYFNTTFGTRVQSTLLTPGDTTVTVMVTSSVVAATAQFLGWSGVPSLFARQGPGDLYNVALANSAGQFLNVVGEAGGQNDLGVSSVNSAPALWQAPSALPAAITATIAAGGTAIIIAGVINQRIRLFGLALTTALNMSLQTSAGIEFGSIAASSPMNVSLGGAPLPVGVGFNIFNGGGVAGNANGTVSYSIG